MRKRSVWNPLDPHTGPVIFRNRLEKAGLRDDRFVVCTSSLRDVTYARHQTGKYLVARLDGVSRYLLSGRNLYGLLRQRRPDLLPFLSAVRWLPTFPTFLSGIFNRYLNRRAVWLLRNAGAIVFQSRLSREMYIKFLRYQPGRVPETVILNGVNLDDFRPRASNRLEGFPALIISAALHRLHKRVQEAIRLVNVLAGDFPRVRLHVLGDFDPLVREVVSTLDTSKCIFHKRLNPEALPELYAGADVQLSLAIFDPCPNVVCEGLASGLPVLTPAESGAAELIGGEKHQWVVEENLALEAYRPFHVASLIPRIPLDKYVTALNEDHRQYEG